MTIIKYPIMDEKLNIWDSFKINHTNFANSYNDLRAAIGGPNNQDIVVVVGPTGVGKTGLLKHFFDKTVERYQGGIAEVPSFIPIAVMEAAPPDSKVFNWKDFYTRALRSLDEKHIDSKFDSYQDYYSDRKEDTTASLRRAFESVLNYRQTVAFLIDEAHHLTRVSSGRKIQDQLEVLKTLSQVTDTTLVLFATYEMMSSLNLSGQLVRRENIIQFPRYKRERGQDVLVFKSILKAFQDKLKQPPISEDVDLLNNWEYFMVRSAGCVGVLKEWIKRSLRAKLYQDNNGSLMPYLEKYAYSDQQCRQLNIEAIQGEQLMEPIEEKSLFSIPVIQTKPEATTPKKGTKKSRKPGLSIPRSYKVGNNLPKGPADPDNYLKEGQDDPELIS